MEGKVRLIAGVDDAGRGSIIGPLVIAGVLIQEDKIPMLKAIGVKDSKLLSSKRREKLSKEIERIVDNYVIVEVGVNEIDRVVKTGKRLQKLNFLEANTMAKVIEKLKPDIAYVDASDVLAERFGMQIGEMISFPVKIISEHKADAKYPVVSAASIVAKTYRDGVIARLREKYGNFGSGYISDVNTRKFLIDWFRHHGSFPDIVRKSWKFAEKVKQSKLI